MVRVGIHSDIEGFPPAEGEYESKGLCFVILSANLWSIPEETSTNTRLTEAV